VLSTGERILQALELGAATIEQLATMLAVSYFTVYSAMTKLERDGAVCVTKLASPRRSGRKQNLYSLGTGELVSLGPVTDAKMPVMARLLGDVLVEHGEVALFINVDLTASIAMQTDSGYDRSLKVHGPSLVGVYRTGRLKTFEPRHVLEDIGERLAELKRRGAHAP